MKKIVDLNQAERICVEFKKQARKIVLVGGCFDIFHYGHFVFLKEAKKLGAVLMIALENDKRVRQLKGENRPITNEKARVEILSSFPFVDYVLTLPNLEGEKAYRDLTIRLKPDIIAITAGDRQLTNKREQAKLVGGKVVIIPHIDTPSTSQILKTILNEQ